MSQYRVGSEGVRIINPDGGGYSLPPGTVIDEMPAHYEGSLELIKSKEVHGYADKMIRPAEDKSL